MYFYDIDLIWAKLFPLVASLVSFSNNHVPFSGNSSSFSFVLNELNINGHN